MGDETGPFEPAAGVIACESCGVVIELDDDVTWTQFPVVEPAPSPRMA